jgi:hypothetical protein
MENTNDCCFRCNLDGTHPSGDLKIMIWTGPEIGLYKFGYAWICNGCYNDMYQNSINSGATKKYPLSLALRDLRALEKVVDGNIAQWMDNEGNVRAVSCLDDDKNPQLFLRGFWEFNGREARYLLNNTLESSHPINPLPTSL